MTIEVTDGKATAIRTLTFNKINAPNTAPQIVTGGETTLGDEIEVPTLDGKVKYTIPEGTQTGTVFRLREKGYVHINASLRTSQ